MGRIFILSLLLLSIVFTGCSSRDAITVDGEGIPKEIFNLALKERLESHKAMNLKANEAAIRRSVADELIGETLLIKEAKTRKITVADSELQEAIAAQRGSRSEKEFIDDLKRSGISYEIFQKRMRDRILITKLLNELVRENSITEEEMRSFYKNSPVPFLKPERVFVKVLQVNTEDEAKKAIHDIRRGEDFDAVSARLVKEQKASATDYGWIEPDVFSKEIADSMKAARLNQAYGPFKGKDNSYYIFRIKDRQPSRVLSYDEAKAQIKNMLISQKRDDAAARIIVENRKKAKIKYNIKV
jgi:foldase protein PrsA